MAQVFIFLVPLSRTASRPAVWSSDKGQSLESYAKNKIKRRRHWRGHSIVILVSGFLEKPAYKGALADRGSTMAETWVGGWGKMLLGIENYPLRRVWAVSWDWGEIFLEIEIWILLFIPWARLAGGAARKGKIFVEIGKMFPRAIYGRGKWKRKCDTFPKPFFVKKIYHSNEFYERVYLGNCLQFKSSARSFITMSFEGVKKNRLFSSTPICEFALVETRISRSPLSNQPMELTRLTTLAHWMAPHSLRVFALFSQLI